MKELTIESIRLSLMNYQRVVILREKDSDRYLPIWIGPAEADAIAVRLQDVAVARPLTHDLLRSMIEQLGGRVAYIVVSDLSNDTFFARIVLDLNGETLEIDSRPSDAIALAVRVDVPIYAEDTVLDRAGVVLDEEGQVRDDSADPLESRKAVDPAELERLGAFKDFIAGLDLSDFDDRTS
ncbi:MAG TPA: bifunctional nuclease family protein [Tepidiformaceae bacterium]|nr:bifunctional nuclease family protein [Tepidiformaceae bacterium]